MELNDIIRPENRVYKKPSLLNDAHINKKQYGYGYGNYSYGYGYGYGEAKKKKKS